MASSWGSSWSVNWGNSWGNAGAPPAAPAVTPAVGHGGRKPNRKRHYVEIDGQYFEVRDHDHAVEILTKLREAAKEAAPVAVQEAAEKRAPVAVPRMSVVKPNYAQEFVQQLQAQVDAANAAIVAEYRAAEQQFMAATLAMADDRLRRVREADEDDIEALLMAGVL